MTKSISLVLSVSVALLTWYSCANAPHQQVSDKGFALHLRMKSEPDRIHPMLSRRGNATQIEHKIFLPLLQVDPTTLQLYPVLAERMPSKTIVPVGPLKGDIWYHMTLRPEARWSDGTPVTSRDYLFTVKASQNPALRGNQWRSLLHTIDSIAPDPGDPKSFEVFVQPGLLSDIVAGNFELYPAHLYDPNGILERYSLHQLKGETLLQDTALLAFSEAFSSAALSRSKVMGNGPYTIKRWEPNQRLILQKKAEWWGEKHANSPGFIAHPDALHYHFIPDETAAIALLKGGKLDQIPDLTPSKFNTLRHSADTLKFGFYTPVGMRYYFIALNNLHPALADVRVRKALAHCVDTKMFIDKMLLGLATPVAGPVHPSKPYVAKDLRPVALDIDLAKELLQSGGWVDSDGDGVLDKVINGKRESLSFEILVTGSELGKNLALLFKQDAARAGIQINVRPQRLSAIIQQVREGKYDMAALAARQSPTYDEMRQSWHSSAVAGRGKNYAFYSNPEVDRWTDSLSIVSDTAQIFELYDKIQRRIYEDQPVIFICAPLERIVVSRAFEPFITTVSPGYDECLYQRKE